VTLLAADVHQVAGLFPRSLITYVGGNGDLRKHGRARMRSIVNVHPPYDGRAGTLAMGSGCFVSPVLCHGSLVEAMWGESVRSGEN